MQLAITGCIIDGSSPVTTTPTQQPLSVPQGNDVVITMTVKGSNGSAFNLTGYGAILLTVKTAPFGGTQIAQLTGTITNASSGLVQFTLPAATTRTLTPGTYPFDVFATNGSGSRDEVVPDSWLTVSQAVGA